MGKSTIIWCAGRLNGLKRGEIVKKLTMKSLAEELGVAYSTAKTKKPEKEMEMKLWIKKEEAFGVWFETIEG